MCYLFVRVLATGAGGALFTLMKALVVSTSRKEEFTLDNIERIEIQMEWNDVMFDSAGPSGPDGGNSMLTDDRLKAAPDMLEALKEAFAVLGKEPRWKVSTLRLDTIRGAIAKAEQGQDEQ